MSKILSMPFSRPAPAAKSEDVPEVEHRQGRIAAMTALTEDVMEVVIEPSSPLAVLPGQYVQVEFAGFPARAFSPTPALDARPDDGLLRFHISRIANGRVSGELGRAIAIKHRVKLSGPQGSAYLRPGMQNRLVLVASGTGFAPIWAVADAALRERPNRSMLLIVGVRSVHSLYMVQALDLMAACPNVRILVTSEERQSVTRFILPGRPTDYMPPLLSRDTVFAAGPAAMVASVGATAAVSGAAFHAQPFLPADDGQGGNWFSRVLWRRGKARPGEVEGSQAKTAPDTLAARLRIVATDSPPPLEVDPSPTPR